MLSSTANKDFNAKFDTFFDEVDRIYKKCCPIKPKNISENETKKPWTSHKFLLRIKRKYYLFQRYKNGASSYPEFLPYQKKKIIQNSKKMVNKYYRDKFKSCRGDSSKTWKNHN